MGNLLLKTNYNTWRPAKQIYVKTNYNTWRPAKQIYVKTNYNTWRPIINKKKVLSEYTWEEIAEISSTGKASEYFSIGDEIDIDINGETLTFQIYGFNHDTIHGGTDKAGITFGMKHLMAKTRKMNNTATNKGSFLGSDLCAYLENNIFASLSPDLQALIKPVSKKTSAGGGSSDILTESMRLFLFSAIENGLRATTDVYKDEGETYPIFTNGVSLIKCLANGVDSAKAWWERSPSTTISNSFCGVNSGGGAGYLSATGSYGVCFGFCI